MYDNNSIEDKLMREITKNVSLNIFKRMTEEISEYITIGNEEQFNTTVLEATRIAISSSQVLEKTYKKRKININYKVPAEIFEKLMPSWKEIKDLENSNIASRIVIIAKRAINTAILFDMSWKELEDDNNDY
ncbi:MAG: hypothetical protein SWX82_08620 [Cyanobacteriota bacterium]|nr:hypothetical protein [Cyanobacteriota bacterium]